MSFDLIYITNYFESQFGISGKDITYFKDLRKDFYLREEEITELLSFLINTLEPGTLRVLKSDRFESIMDIVFFFALNDMHHEYNYRNNYPF